MKKTTFIQDEQAVWLKGNLHTHSTNSDGCLTPVELAEGYKNKGYDFLAITDHDVFYAYPECCSDDFIMIPAVELTGPVTELKKSHFGVLQKGEACDFEQGQRFALKTRQDTIEFFEKYHENYMIILNHPYWSLLEWEEVMDIPYLTCMEVYNRTCELSCNVGEGAHFWNTMLRKGKAMWGVATDDAHNPDKHLPGWPFASAQCDSFGGWICVKAKTRTREGIIEALEHGSFYASTGPEIYDFYVEGDRFYFKCSPCQSIILSGDWRYYQKNLGDGVTEFSGTLRGPEKFIRIECTDKEGRKAYTNPIFLT